MKNNNDKKRLRTIKTTKFMINYTWSKAEGKKYIIATAIRTVFNAFFPFVYTIMPGLIINELMEEQDIKKIFIYLAILLVSPVLNQIINYFLNTYVWKLNDKLKLLFESDFLEHTMDLAYESIEDPAIQAKRDRAESTMYGILDTVGQLNSLIGAVITTGTIIVIVSTLSPLIILTIVLSIFVNSLFAKKINERLNKIDVELSLFDRFLSAYMWMMEGYDFAKENRLFGIKSLLLEKYVERKEKANVLDIKHNRLQNMPNVFNAVTYLFQQLVLYLYLLYKVLFRNMPIGNMTIYISIAGQFTDALNRVVSTCLELSSKTSKIEEFIDYMNFPSAQQMNGVMIPIFENDSTIEFKDVSFKYPGSENYAIRHLNLTIHAGEKLCIVGSNGSGKTTFIKLLTRLYPPTEGEITLNGVNICEYDYRLYLNLFSPVFQDFASYYMTIKENIVLNNVNNQRKFDEVCVNGGLVSLGKRQSKGFDTQVGKWFDDEGFEPSGGEGQRIAIARACYRDGAIYLLDEPTASLDPNAEYEIYSQFHSMTRSKTALFVTHRLSAVQLADRVVVFDNGAIIEFGTHTELYEKGGIYRQMFDKQAKFYRDNSSSNS